MSRNTRWSSAERTRAGGAGALLACALAVAAAATVPEFVQAELAPAIASSTASAANDESSGASLRANLRALGHGRMRWFGLHIYDATLYAAAPFATDRAGTQAFVLELTYARTLSGRDIAVRSRDEIARLGFGTEAQREQWLAQMTKIFPDVKEGDRIAGVNRPGASARFFGNGKLIGAIDDPEFAPAFFAIWLDARTSAPSLREDLLKKATGS